MELGLFIQEPAKSSGLLFKKPEVVLFTGPMFVGKTTTMFKAVTDHADKGDHSVIIKPGTDSRGSFDTIFTHDGDKKNQNVSIIVADTIQEAFLSLPDNVKVVGIDEGQFFPDLYKLTDSQKGLNIYISALSGDFLQRPFAGIEKLVAACTELKVVTLTGKCMGEDGCPNPSEYSIRSIKDDRLVVVGGSELYKAVCYKCLKFQE